MSEVQATVARGYTWVQDANGRVRLTEDRMNLAALPRVSVDLALGIATADIQENAVEASKLSAALQQLLPGAPTLVAGVEVNKVIIVSVQLNDAVGNPLTTRRRFTWWISNTPGGDLAGAPSPSGATVVEGDQRLSDYSMWTHGSATSEAEGTATIAIENNTADKFFLSVDSGGEITEVAVDFGLV